MVYRGFRSFSKFLVLVLFTGQCVTCMMICRGVKSCGVYHSRVRIDCECPFLFVVDIAAICGVGLDFFSPVSGIPVLCLMCVCCACQVDVGSPRLC